MMSLNYDQAKFQLNMWKTHLGYNQLFVFQDSLYLAAILQWVDLKS